MEEKKLVPKKRFSEHKHDGAWSHLNWKDTVDISINMVDPRNDEFSDLPHIGPGNIKSFTGLLLNNINTVKEDNLISGKFHFNVGDIIYGKINPQLGKYTYALYEGLASADTYILNAKNELEQGFLFVLLQTKHFFNYSVSVSKRSGMPKINRDELNEYTFCAPNKQEQQKIGEFFKVLADRIANQERKIAKVKALKAAYLTEMFPQEGETVPKRRFQGFEDEWTKIKLHEKGKTISGVGFPDIEQGGTKGIPFYKISDMNLDENKVEMHVSNNFVTEAQIKRKRWSPITSIPAIIFAKVGAAIFMNRKRLVNETFLIDNNTMAYIFNDEWDVYFGKNLFDTINLPDYAQVGALPSYNGTEIEEIEVLMPHIAEQQKIGEFFKNLDNQIEMEEKKLDKLQKMKEAYLEEMFV